MESALTMISLFAGVGGFDLGFEEAGIKVVAHVERDPACQKLLKARWPDAVALDDVCTAGKHNLPKSDIICAGFPCQDVSVAGQRAGLAGNRSGLFYQFTRIAHELQSACLVWENVAGLLSSNKGHDFLAILAEFRRIGYHGGWRTFDAQYFGVAQRRRRIFGVFTRGDIGIECASQILSLREGMRGHPAPRREKGQKVADTVRGGTASGSNEPENKVPHVAAPLTVQHGAVDRGDCSQTLIPEVAGTLDQRCGRSDATAEKTYIPDVAKTLTAGRDGYNDGSDQTYLPQIAARMTAFGEYVDDGTASTIKQRDWKDATDLVVTQALTGSPYADSPGREDKLVVFDEKQITSPDNRSSVEGEVSPTLNPAGQMTAAVVPIHSDAEREGVALTPAPDAEGNVRLRNPGLGIGDDGDPMFSLMTAGKQHAIAIRTANTGANGHGVSEDAAHTLDGNAGSGQAVAIAFTERGRKEGRRLEHQEDVAYTLTNPGDGGRTNDRQVAIAFQPRIGRNGRDQPEEIVPALNGADSGETSDSRPCVAFTIHGSDKTKSTATETEVAGSVRTKAPGSIENSSTTVAVQEITAFRSVMGGNDGGAHQDGTTPTHTPRCEPAFAQATMVRRLTPTECERLQGFPDGHTKAFSDSTRYKMLGNAVCVACGRWLGKRIVEFLPKYLP